MSRILVDQIRSNSASADAMTLDGSGNVTFPANATCSGTATGFGGGKILQVVTGSTTTTVSSSSSDHIDTGLTCSITTTTNSSKVFVTISQSLYCRNPGGSTYSRAGVRYDLMRDTTVIQEGTDNILLWGATYSPYIVTGQMAAVVHLDTPGNAGTYTYKTTAQTVAGNWKAQDNDSPSHIVLMEIGA